MEKPSDVRTAQDQLEAIWKDYLDEMVEPATATPEHVAALRSAFFAGMLAGGLAMVARTAPGFAHSAGQARMAIKKILEGPPIVGES